MFTIATKNKTTTMNNQHKKAAYWLDSKNLERMAGWIRDGLTDAQLAERMGIHRSTLYKWRSIYPVFDEIIMNSKEVIDYQVEKALLKRALGYQYTETTFDADGNIISQSSRHQAPDTKACFLWLKNRRPDKWRNVQQIDASITSATITNMKELSRQELKQLATINVEGELLE